MHAVNLGLFHALDPGGPFRYHSPAARCGKGDDMGKNSITRKMRQRASQAKKKTRIKAKIEAGKKKK